MCRRFTQYTTKREIVKVFHLDTPFDLPLHYDIAPTQQVAVTGQTVEGNRKMATLGN